MRESTLWFWHIIAGAVILVLLGLHMAIMHLDDILACSALGHANIRRCGHGLCPQQAGLFHGDLYYRSSAQPSITGCTASAPSSLS